MRKANAVAAVLMLILAGGATAADPLVENARKVVQEYASAVIHVEAVLSITVDSPMAALAGGDREQKVKVVGTVIDPSGLTVTSLTSLDPTSGMGKMNVKAGGQDVSMSFKGELSEVKLRLADGTELPARVVLKDEDLDLAFVAPKEAPDAAKAKFQVVDVRAAAGKAEPLARTIALGRLDKDLNHEPTVQLGTVAAVVSKPRTLYVVDDAVGGGCPIFTEDGLLLGLGTIRRKPDAADGSRAVLSMMLGGAGGGMPVVLPVEDVRKIAEQAREEMAKKVEEPDKKAEEPAKETPEKEKAPEKAEETKVQE